MDALFRLEPFGVWHAVDYLYRYSQRSIQEFVCRELPKLNIDQIEFYLPQFVYALQVGRFLTVFRNLALYRDGSDLIEDFLIDLGAKSPHFCVQICWQLEAVAHFGTPAIAKRAEYLRKKCETSCMNSEVEDLAVLESQHALSKETRCLFFNSEFSFINNLVKLSADLRMFPVENRSFILRRELEKISKTLPAGVYLPLENASAHHHFVVGIQPKECIVLNSKQRVPYLAVMEVCDAAHKTSSAKIHSAVHASAQALAELALEQEAKRREERDTQPGGSDSESVTSEKSDTVYPPPPPRGIPPDGETKGARESRIRQQSPLGQLRNWRLMEVIVKSGEDLRQELLAQQLVQQFKFIFDEAQLPLHVRPFKVIVTGADSGLIEVVPDSVSIHSLKTSTKNFTTLNNYFKTTYSPYGLDTMQRAKRLFAESCAAYSVICYLLAVKDRHNGNILICDGGQIVHIDFGFILGLSPAMAWENAPFKLSPELIEVLEGLGSPLFGYFRELFIKGFIAARRHNDKIMSLVDMARLGGGRSIPCFADGGDKSLLELKERFKLEKSESDIVVYANDLINSAASNWRTRQYDNFQYMFNGIR